MKELETEIDKMLERNKKALNNSPNGYNLAWLEGQNFTLREVKRTILALKFINNNNMEN